MIGKLLTAVALSFVILPTAAYIAPDPYEASDVSVSNEVLARAKTHVDTMAAAYGVKAPTVRFTDSAVAGFTVEKWTSEGKTAEIRLGRPIQSDAFRERPGLLDAVLSHETGHAVMIARNEAFPPAAIIVLYAIGVFPFLIVFPTKRGLIGAAFGLCTCLTLICSVQSVALPHLAFQYLIIGRTMASIASWALKPRVPSCLQDLFGRQLRPHLPTARVLTFSGLIAIPAFFIAAWLLGGLNNQRELRADVFGACSTSPAAMKEALLLLTENRNGLREALDSFHPSLSDRIALLEAMENETTRKSACGATHTRSGSLTIGGQTVL